MPVTKFKSISEMPPAPRVEGPELFDRIRVLWNRAFTLSPPDFLPGVTRFRTIADANQARFDSLIVRMRRVSSRDRTDAQAEDGTRAKLAVTEHSNDPKTEPDGGPDGGTSRAG